MLKREERKPNLDSLLHLVAEVVAAIQDNNQNISDCSKLLREIQNILEPHKKTRWERIKDVFR